MSVAKIKDKSGIFDTREVLFRYEIFGSRSTYIDLDALVRQFSYDDRDLEVKDLKGFEKSNMINKKRAEIFDIGVIKKLELTRVFDSEIIRALRVNLKCIGLALDRISRMDVDVSVINGKEFVGISVQDLQKVTFCDNAWINGGQIMTDLSCKKENSHKTLTYRSNKKTFITPSGVRCFCKESGVADRLLVDDINARIMKFYGSSNK